MATAGHSRRHGTRQQPTFSPRLIGFLRVLASAASGKPHRSKEASRRGYGDRGYGDPQHHAQRSRRRPRDWIVTRQVGATRLGLTVVLAFALAWIGWRIIAQTAAENLAVSAPADALAWAPRASTALDQLAQEELRRPGGDLDAAAGWASQALRASPLDARALFLLGAVADRKGETKKADELMRAAGARSWRNLAVQLWLFEHDVGRQDYAAALAHADAMFRVEPKLLGPIFPALAAFTTDPVALKLLAGFLASDPPWRSWFVQSLAQSLYDKAHLDQVYSMLAGSKSPPKKAELRAYLNRLVKDGRYEFAYRKWRESMVHPPGATNDFLFNGNFALRADGLPFNWSIATRPGADVRIVPTGRGKERALRVQFSGARVQFANVRQLLLLPPGRYRLTGWVKAEHLRTSRGLWWHVSCVGGSAATLAQTDLVSGNVPWREFAVDFEVPGQGCTAQRLQLELPARIPPCGRSKARYGTRTCESCRPLPGRKPPARYYGN